MAYTVYEITCAANGKRYIGLTKRSMLELRRDRLLNGSMIGGAQ